MVAGMRSRLAAAGLDVEKETAAGGLVLSSDESHLSGLGCERGFDPDRMLAMLGDALDQALRDGYTGLWASGDMTWEFGPEKNFAKLRAYEYGLERLFRTRPELQGICQYHADTLPPEVFEEALYTHRAVYINQTLARTNPYFVPPYSPARANIQPNDLRHMLATPHCQGADFE